MAIVTMSCTSLVQLGVFSPINRLHSSKNEFMGKEPWQFPMEIGEVMKEFLRLRHQMLPYLYTMNHRAYKENTPLILPMYYTYPAEQVAYTVKNEYEYGTAFIVAPVTEKSVQGVGRARTHVWLPEGTYIDFFTVWYTPATERWICTVTFIPYRSGESRCHCADD